MYQKPFVGTPTDYSKKRNWLSLPDNKDKAADLVFLYPECAVLRNLLDKALVHMDQREDPS